MLLKFLLLPIFADASFDLNFMNSKKIEFMNNSNISLISQNADFENIGIVDFRFILKKSEAMKKIGDEFLFLEKKLNLNMKDKQKYLKNKELIIKKEKLKLTNQEYSSKLDSFKAGLKSNLTGGNCAVSPISNNLHWEPEYTN